MIYSGAEIIVKLLERQGIDTICGIPGGSNLPIYHALSKSTIRHILARHEQGAGFIAQGIARVSGKPAVCLASSGPGATNLLTAVADAKMDSIPLIAITGQVPSSLIGTDAFQEADTFGLMLPITKHNWIVRSVDELLSIIPQAFRLAMSGRPGPVAIDIPKDIQTAKIEIEEWPAIACKDPVPLLENEEPLQQALSMLQTAAKPLFMIGGGVVHSACHEALFELAVKQDIPAVATFMGLGVIPYDHPLFLGMLGMHGARYTNMALEECDLLIGVGVRFDDRATGDPLKFCPNARIIHVDIDASELNKIKPAQLSLNTDVAQVIHYLKDRVDVVQRSEWRERIEYLRKHFPLQLHQEQQQYCPYNLLKSISEMAPANNIVVTDVGQHQMWTAQAYPFRFPRQWVSSGGLGTMGFGLPAAIGAALSKPDHTVLCISGDGSLMMNLQELDTLAEHGLNVKVIVMNNKHLGLVRQQQTLFYESRYLGINNQRSVDFAGIALSMGIQGVDLEASGDPMNDLQQALQSPGPALINIPIDPDVMVFPMVPPGAGNKDMIVHDTLMQVGA